ncbi:MAG TPA: flavin reductase family protein, partial [Duganella sp.]|nr:flavin reductase family protein [Duganella sp.]
MNTRGLPCSPVSNISEWPSLDARALRAALERLTTSTALITASGPDGDLIGATASSFNSISDNPPLVLWSLSRAADAVAVFSNAAHWAVHVLSPGQSDLHARLTRAEHGRFDGVAFERGIEGVPLLDGCLARFVCRGVHAYETPDHLVLIGEVVQLQHNDMPARARHDSQAANGDDGGPAA